MPDDHNGDDLPARLRVAMEDARAPTAASPTVEARRGRGRPRGVTQPKVDAEIRWIIKAWLADGLEWLALSKELRKRLREIDRPFGVSIDTISHRIRTIYREEKRKRIR